MKKFLISAVLIFSFSAYAVYQHTHNSTQATVPLQTVDNSLVTPVPTSNTPTPTPTPTPTGQYKDGQYTGTAVDVFYGNVQVRTTVKNGKITDVFFLQYPNDRGHSVELSNYALPILRSEAITAQSAQVDAVSGATQTSRGFVQSLQSALIQAKA